MTRCLALTLTCFLAVAAAAQDAVTIKLKERGEGDAALISRTEVGNFYFKIVNAQGKVQTEQKNRTSDIKEYSETILKRDPARIQREYSKAQSSKGATVVEWPIVGKPILIEKKDAKYIFTFKTGEMVTGVAADGLNKEFSNRTDQHTEFQRLILPKAPVKPGDSWQLDMDAIAKHLSKGGEVDLSVVNAKGVVNLEKVYKDDGHLFGVISYKVELPVRALGKGEKAIKCTDGKITINGTMDLCIDGTIEMGTLKNRMMTVATMAPLPGQTATLSDIKDQVQTNRPASKK